MLRIQIQIDAAIFIDSKFKFVYGLLYTVHCAYTVDINAIISPPYNNHIFSSFCFPSQ